MQIENRDKKAVGRSHPCPTVKRVFRVRLRGASKPGSASGGDRNGMARKGYGQRKGDCVQCVEKMAGMWDANERRSPEA